MSRSERDFENLKHDLLVVALRLWEFTYLVDRPNRTSEPLAMFCHGDVELWTPCSIIRCCSLYLQLPGISIEPFEFRYSSLS
jgi:hypothetical protein